MLNCNRSSEKEQLLHQIDEVSFAVNDIHLYLNTHPCDEKAMAFFNENSRKRKMLMEEYAQTYGPLTIDTAAESCGSTWKWAEQPFPWEKEGGCR